MVPSLALIFHAWTEVISCAEIALQKIERLAHEREPPRILWIELVSLYDFHRSVSMKVGEPHLDLRQIVFIREDASTQRVDRLALSGLSSVVSCVQTIEIVTIQ